MSDMKYNVGDRVRIKNFDWFRNEGANMVVVYMTKYYGEVVTIKSVHKGFYRIKEDGGQYCWIDEMFECKMEEETKPKYEDEVNGEYYSTPKYLVRPNGYQFVDENGNVINAQKIVLEKKKKEYPKTYEECGKIMNCPIGGPSGWLFNFDANIKDTYYRKIDILMGKFTRLFICRDAYWKIAGEEMGLGKPWSPDYSEESYEQGCPIKYVIYYTGTHITKERKCTPSYVLSFPTEEMRDIFYENFKSEIESCKEFL